MDVVFTLIVATAAFVAFSLTVAVCMTIRDWFRYRSAPRPYVTPRRL
jgi:hypothetical protein